MTIEDVVLADLHRATREAGRPSIAIPSKDLDVAARRAGGRVAAKQALARLVSARRVVRVRRDLLLLPDPTGLLNIECDDLVEAIAPTAHLITAGAALAHLGLTDQHYFGLVVLVPTEIATLTYRSQTVKFYKTDPTNIWGSTRGATPRYACPERALLDAVNHPRYGVSLTQSVDALVRAESSDPEFLDRLQSAVHRYGARGHGSRSAARRFGLIIDRLYGPSAAAPYREMLGPNRAPVLLRPGGSHEGAVDPTWRVLVNAVLEPEAVW